ncbi:MAG: DMT family transporter [Alphaproteobacteria bacterium]
MNRSALGTLAAAATGVQVGAAIVATRYVAADISPASLAFLRYSIGVACLIPVVAMAQRVRFARADILPIAALGVGQFGILIALLNYGLRSVPAGRGALIFASFPLITLIVAALLGHEHVTVRKVGGILATMAGVALALGDKILGAGSILGELTILASAAVGAVCSVLYRPYLRRYPTLPVSAFAMAAAALALFPFAALDDLFVAPAQLSASAWGAIVFIGLSSGTFYVVWLWALKTIPASRVTVFLALSPVTAIVLGVALLGEPVTAGMMAGVACVAAGLWVANSEA